MSWFCSVSFIIVSSSPICCLIVTFLILYFLDILEDFLRASISVASTRLLLFSVILHVSEPYNKLLLISALYWGHLKLKLACISFYFVEVTQFPVPRTLLQERLQKSFRRL